ncbi:CsbD family protein [Patulibacter defluvii]|uniref:CsbD family protein n=1 Tax=Patulibacter defluvii TaxID=3095358 RepID=UPI002A75264D|nr:CsbD family protein [Patulibacter sp. DM4]
MTDTDRLKGQAKEAAGAVTDDDELRREGRTDQRVGQAKEAIDDARDKARSLVDQAKDKLTGR